MLVGLIDKVRRIERASKERASSVAERARTLALVPGVLLRSHEIRSSV